jgi:hypothetical protein
VGRQRCQRFRMVSRNGVALHQINVQTIKLRLGRQVDGVNLEASKTVLMDLGAPWSAPKSRNPALASQLFTLHSGLTLFHLSPEEPPPRSIPSLTPAVACGFFELAMIAAKKQIATHPESMNRERLFLLLWNLLCLASNRNLRRWIFHQELEKAIRKVIAAHNQQHRNRERPANCQPPLKHTCNPEGDRQYYRSCDRTRTAGPAGFVGISSHSPGPTRSKRNSRSTSCKAAFMLSGNARLIRAASH